MIDIDKSRERLEYAPALYAKTTIFFSWGKDAEGRGGPSCGFGETQDFILMNFRLEM